MEQTKKKCPFCGEEIMADAKKCRFCGEWLDKPDTHSSNWSKKEKSTWLYIAIAAVAVIVVVALFLIFSAKDTESAKFSEEGTSAVVDDYSIEQVNFDPKSLVALNLMGRDDAYNILRASGWQATIVGSNKDGSKRSDGYIRDLSSDNIIYLYLPDQSAAQHGEGFIEFLTTSKAGLNHLEQSLKEMGFFFKPTNHETKEIDDADGQLFIEVVEGIYEKTDSENAPTIGILQYIGYKDKGLTIPSDAFYTLYIKKIPVNIKK